MPKLNYPVNIYSPYIVTNDNKPALKPCDCCIPSTDTKRNSDVIQQTPVYQKWYEQSLLKAPDVVPPPITNIYEHLYQIPPSGETEVALSDLSNKDSIWDEQRFKTEQVGDIYSYNAEFERYAERMMDCSTWLAYGFSDDVLKLKNANFCRVRHCPVCQWRRSLYWKANMYKAYEPILKEYPKHRWLFLTLTVKNCDIKDLRETINNMNHAWEKLRKRLAFTKGVVGWVRTTEITKSNIGEAHPHFHALLLVKPSYFSHNYIKQDEWTELWKSCLKVDYDPMVNIKAVKPNKKKNHDLSDAIKAAIVETLKYSVKPSDMIGKGTYKDNAWFYELTRQCFKLRFIASGGALKDAFKRAEQITNDDLVDANKDENNNDNDERRLTFTYKNEHHKYFYNPKFNQ